MVDLDVYTKLWKLPDNSPAIEDIQKRKANQLSFTNFYGNGVAKIKPYSGRIPACGVFCGVL